MAISRKTGSLAVAAAATFATVVAFTPTDASAQYRRHGGGLSRPGAVAVGGYRGGYRGGYNRGGRWGGGAAAAGIIGGLALGALAAGAMAPPPPAPAYPAYGPGPGYGVYGGGCEVRRERYWDGWSWRTQRVRVCY